MDDGGLTIVNTLALVKLENIRCFLALIAFEKKKLPGGKDEVRLLILAKNHTIYTKMGYIYKKMCLIYEETFGSIKETFILLY